jgi:hypothetical protein
MRRPEPSDAILGCLVICLEQEMGILHRVELGGKHVDTVPEDELSVRISKRNNALAV